MSFSRMYKQQRLNISFARYHSYISVIYIYSMWRLSGVNVAYTMTQLLCITTHPLLPGSSEADSPRWRR